MKLQNTQIAINFPETDIFITPLMRRYLRQAMEVSFAKKHDGQLGRTRELHEKLFLEIQRQKRKK